MAVATHLADESALTRLDNETVARRLGPMIEAGLVGTCGIIELEIRFSARSPADFEQISHDRALGYESFPAPDEIWDRALEVQRALSERGPLRAVKLPDLLIAATAERARDCGHPVRRRLRPHHEHHRKGLRMGRTYRLGALKAFWSLTGDRPPRSGGHITPPPVATFTAAQVSKDRRELALSDYSPRCSSALRSVEAHLIVTADPLRRLLGGGHHR